MRPKFFQQRSVVWVDLNLGPPVGNEFHKVRPCVVISPDSHNRGDSCILIVPITTLTPDRKVRVNVEVPLPKGEGGLKVDSLALPLHVRSIDPSVRIKDAAMGQISEEKLELIARTLYQLTGQNM